MSRQTGDRTKKTMLKCPTCIILGHKVEVRPPDECLCCANRHIVNCYRCGNGNARVMENPYNARYSADHRLVPICPRCIRILRGR